MFNSHEIRARLKFLVRAARGNERSGPVRARIGPETGRPDASENQPSGLPAAVFLGLQWVGDSGADQSRLPASSIRGRPAIAADRDKAADQPYRETSNNGRGGTAAGRL